ncbi:hypothetical protein ACTACK_10540 [Pseudomonas syringae]|uniref:hypothetical protein n=1 Tax=Pseudomonas syringae TaxID=317 RepID=UPI003F755EDF
MKTESSAAPQETQEEIDARLKQEAIDAGDIILNLIDGQGEQSAAAGTAVGKADPEIDLETLAAIAGEDKPRMIPHARFNEVNEEAKAHRARVLQLEEELARSKGSAPATAPAAQAEADKSKEFDFDAAEESYSTAILDGDQTKAKQIRAQIRKEEQIAADARAEAAADRRYAANRQKDDQERAKLEFDLELAKAYSAHPFLDADSADKNQDAIEEVLVWVQHFTGKGETPAKALASAVGKVAPRYAPAAAVKPAEAPKPDLSQGLARSKQIPPQSAGVGERASSIDVSKMSTKDIKNLSAEDEARLAGDYV